MVAKNSKENPPEYPGIIQGLSLFYSLVLQAFFSLSELNLDQRAFSLAKHWQKV